MGEGRQCLKPQSQCAQKKGASTLRWYSYDELHQAKHQFQLLFCTHCYCCPWSLVCGDPCYNPPTCSAGLLAPVHKHDFRRGLMDAGFRDTVLQMNHSCPIPRGAVQRGINIQNHHSWHMDNVPITAQPKILCRWLRSQSAEVTS